MATIDDLLSTLWEDWRTMAPQADRIRGLLEARGERFVSDHLALRTFDHPDLTMDALAAPFVEAGYAEGATYRFGEKRLVARHWSPPRPDLPRLFVSQLCCKELSATAQDCIRGLVSQLGDSGTPHRLPSRPWVGRRRDWELLAAESEYAAWLCAFGLRANHFTVSVNALTTFGSLTALNDFILGSDIPLNRAGGLIKGDRRVGLEQSSTLAPEVEVELLDGTVRVPGCYVEFALRHPGPDGALFDGFVSSSANRIFESTDLQ